MPKNTYLHDNNEVNLILKGFTSILIGIYLFCGAYLIKSILDGFLIDNHLTSMFSVEIIEYVALANLAFSVCIQFARPCFCRKTRCQKT